MPVLSLIGIQWGDEGKGKILDLISQRADVVVRYQGGANAGHTVVVGGEKFVFHLLPSGVLHADKQIVLASGMVVDPAQLLKELDYLGQRGRTIDGRLFVSRSAHLVLPYHKALDVATEGFKGGMKLGTTGRGIGPAYADKAARTGIRVGELYSPLFEERLRANVEEKNRFLSAVYGARPLSADEILREYLGYAKLLQPFVADTHTLLLDALDAGRYVFIEGAQGVLLDLDHGTYPYVTSSNASALGIPAGTGIPPKRVGEVMGVVKAYTTRVGEGPFPTELEDANGARLRERGDEFGTTTGRPRRCGWFDAVAARYAVRINGVDSLAITKLDTLSGFDRLQVCTSYEVDGAASQRFPTSFADFAKIRPRYETFPGWTEDIQNVRQYDDLPESARRYVETLEAQVRVKATIISVGPGREQTITR